jgi:hypothetical protein
VTTIPFLYFGAIGDADYNFHEVETLEHRLAALDLPYRLERFPGDHSWLTPELAARYSILKASVIMVDSDLYSSAKTALEFCATLIHDDAVVFFDDWWPESLGANGMGEKRAFDEFLEAHPVFTVTELDSYYPKAARVFLVSRSPVRHVAGGDT